jgi:hypothetical protein
MRRSKKNGTDQYGGLAGWLFADVALVLAIAFLSSQVIGGPNEDDEPPVTTTTSTTLPGTATTLLETSQPGSVDVKEIVISGVCVSDPTSIALASQRVEKKLLDAGVSTDSQFGVVLVYAGYRELAPTQDLAERQAEAKKRAEIFRDTMKRWPRLSNERWVKDLGHDAGTNIGCYKLYLLRELKND